MGYLEDLFGLDGKVAVVVGGGGVLGGAMCLALAKAGARVVVVDLDLEKASARAAEIAALGREAIALRADAANKSDLAAAAQAVEEAFHRVDILINAPGINSATPFFEIGEEEWNKILDVNLKSMFLACQIFGRKMIEQGEGGSIINISSASSGPPLSKVFTYSISKAGVNNLTQSLAREWAPHRVRVNAIAPGFFPAEQNRRLLTEDRTKAIFSHTPMRRFGEPEELAGAVLWLASEKASSFVTGAIVRVDGGFSAMTI
ncbi:MAG: glucose 1-dehydrogenase [bacterium]|jgi:NAD(P)-dependent dehydrogenase (short-subunit alcohol dehydrogenase family)|nr:glucose 1-dehydrogenase [candidate division KSB1 bacterium]MDH7558640.1 glucose 1-dehydrogenase [bacterium]